MNWAGQRSRNRRRLYASAMSLALLAGCAVGPDYHRPVATTIPAEYAGNTNGWKVAEPQAHLPKGRWWEMFGDPELNRLEVQAAAANQNLKASIAAFEQARALVGVARAPFYPQLSVPAAALRQRDSNNRPVNGAAAGFGDNYYNFTVPLDFNYELDVWGRVRRSVEQARATEQADAADVETTRLGIQSDVASDYFTLQALDAESALLRSSIQVFEKSLELTRNRRAGGIATDLDVAQAKTVLETTVAQLPDIALQRARVDHALAILVGLPASSFQEPEQSLNIEPSLIPPGVPSELLERRPDIAAAERRMASANAGIGVAKSAFFPAIMCNGLGGFQSVDIGTLFNWPSRFWAVGPSVTVPLFQGGALRANLRLAQATYDQVVAQYRQTVLSAFGEVEDNLAAQHLLAGEYTAQVAAVDAARTTLEVASNRYRAGLVTYLEVATAQNTELDLERTSVRLRGEQLVATVSLIKSLGGGWQAPLQQAAINQK
jgi:outer membrane protein, multidrug efflux system